MFRCCRVSLCAVLCYCAYVLRFVGCWRLLLVVVVVCWSVCVVYAYCVGFVFDAAVN